jgi:hypothetical protein
MTQSDARVALPPPRAVQRPAAPDAEGYDSDITRDDEPGAGKAKEDEDVMMRECVPLLPSVPRACHRR